MESGGMQLNFRWITIAVFGLIIVTMGCSRTVQKELIATGGSRADGTVQLSFEHGSLEKPQLDLIQGLATAKQRCAAWGYSDAEQFGGNARQCQVPSQYGCMRWYVTVTYQCLGKPKRN